MDKREFIIAPETVKEIKGYKKLLHNKKTGYVMWAREDLNP